MPKSLLSAVDRLYNNSLVDEDTNCWLWQGCVHEKGYGRIMFNGRVEKVHRLSFLYYIGDIVEGVFHTCDVPNCWNPDHLFTGTNIDNVNDRMTKGRQTRGVNHPKNKLTEDQVREIRTSSLSRKALARVYGVTPQNIRNIQNFVIWRHLDAP